MNKPRLWTKDFIAVSLIGFFLSLSFQILLVIIAVYTMDTFQSSPSLAGLAAGMFMIGAIIMRIIFGRWIERIGRRKILLAVLTLNLVSAVLYFMVNSYLFLLAVRFLHGAAFGIAITVITTIVAGIIPEKRRGEGLAYNVSFGTLAAAIGPFSGLFLIQHGSYNTIFIVSTIFSIISLITAFSLSVPEIKLTEEQLKETKEFKFSRFFATKAIPISIICFICYFAYSCVQTFLSAYAKEINLLGIASFFFIASSISILITRPFIGRLFDSKGENVVMYPAFVIFMVGLFILSQTHSGFTLISAAVLVGVGLGMIPSSVYAIAIKVVPSHQIGLATATIFTFQDAGAGTGPFIGGLFIPFIGYQGMYIGVAIIILMCIFLYYLLHGKEAGRIGS